jgi:hypothetical protein
MRQLARNPLELPGPDADHRSNLVQAWTVLLRQRGSNMTALTCSARIELATHKCAESEQIVVASECLRKRSS